MLAHDLEVKLILLGTALNLTFFFDARCKRQLAVLETVFVSDAVRGTVLNFLQQLGIILGGDLK